MNPASTLTRGSFRHNGGSEPSSGTARQLTGETCLNGGTGVKASVYGFRFPFLMGAASIQVWTGLLMCVVDNNYAQVAH